MLYVPNYDLLKAMVRHAPDDPARRHLAEHRDWLREERRQRRAARLTLWKAWALQAWNWPRQVMRRLA